jgi:lysophospholipase L1-like esterase
MTSYKRRDFLKDLTASTVALALAPQFLHAADFEKKETNDANGFSFLFQGDSITDGGRGRNEDWNHVMGQDYVFLISSRLWYDFPGEKFHFFNRGISGNKITDLAERWQTDTLDLKPDLLSILIGINDTSAWINGDNTFAVENYEARYHSLLQQTRQALPKIQFVICEPFILPVGNVKNRWEEYQSGVQQRQAAAKRLALEFNAVYVEFQDAFNRALKKAPADYWIWDGIHPTPAGHEMMAREWIQQVNRKLKLF